MSKQKLVWNSLSGNVLQEVNQGLSRIYKDLVDLNKDIQAAYDRLCESKQKRG